MNPKIKIGKLRNRRTQKHYKKEDVRRNYQWTESKKFTRNGETFKIYKFSKQGKRPVPRNSDNGLMTPPIWEGNLQESPIDFYSEDSNGKVVIDVGTAAAQMHEKWGEGIYQVQRYPDEKVHTISNLFDPALVVKLK